MESEKSFRWQLPAKNGECREIGAILHFGATEVRATFFRSFDNHIPKVSSRLFASLNRAQRENNMSARVQPRILVMGSANLTKSGVLS
jgi:hypothetical protein